MLDIKFENIVLSKLYPFKNTDGQYCFINYRGGDTKEVMIDNNNSEVAYDTKNGIVMLNINQKGFTNIPSFFSFLDKLKENLINLVYEKGVYGNISLQTLSEFYVSPHKVSKNGKDLLKCKCNGLFDRKTKVKVSIHISGMWFGQSSFGPYFTITQIEKIQNVCLIKEDSDSDTEINIVN
jgi:hypothetical protein